MVKKISLVLLLLVVSFALSATPKVALVLSGGGARGFAHIPVIEAIEALGIPIDLVLGTSMGSLVGGLYAAGYSPKDIRDLIEAYSMVDLFTSTALPPISKFQSLPTEDNYNLLKIGLDKEGVGTATGIIGDQKILQMLNASFSRVAGVKDFDQLEIPFRAIGTDLVSGERLVFSSGSIVTAIRSSISIPGVFAPYPVANRLVVDGGVADNLPIDLAQEMGADIIIAVDVNGGDYEKSINDINSLSAVLEQTIILFMKNTYFDQLQNADLLVIPKLGAYSILDFLNVKEILAIGAEAVKEKEGEFKALAQRVESERGLIFKEANRTGAYFALGEPIIAAVVHRPLGRGEATIELAPFRKFTGQRLNKKVKEQLQRELNNLRNKGQFATATYSFGEAFRDDTGELWGILEIQTREFPPKKATLSVGAYGAAAITFDPLYFEFTPNFAFQFTNDSLFNTSLKWSFALSLGDTLKLSNVLLYPFSSLFSSGLKFSYLSGAILPEHLRYGDLIPASRDRKIDGELLLRYHPTNALAFQLTAAFPYIWYDSDSKAEIFAPKLQLEGTYSTLNSKIIPLEGLRLDFSLTGEKGESYGYWGLLRYQQMFKLEYRHYLYLDLRAQTSRPATLQASSFVQFGGSDGLPTYLNTALTDDLLIGRIKYLYLLNEKTLPLVLHTMVSIASRGNIIKETPVSSSLVPFSALNAVEGSFSLALGFSVGSVEFLAGAALDTNLRATIFLEVM